MSTDANSTAVQPILFGNIVDTVHFPPRQYADFVIDYADTAFYVHKFMLHHHSAYFRTYLETLSPPATSQHTTTASTKERKRKSSRSCNHSSIEHCVHLPQQTTLVDKKAVTAAHFRFFLCHLYFGTHYCYPPYLPEADIDLDNPPPVSLSFTPVLSLEWSHSGPLRDTADGNILAMHESLLMPAHYLDCESLTQQSEAVLLKAEPHAAKHKSTAWLCSRCVFRLQYADCYKLAKSKLMCIKIIAEAKGELLLRARSGTER